ALPRAQAELAGGADHVAVVSPAYRVDPARFHLERRRRVAVPLGGRAIEVEVLAGRLPAATAEVDVWLIDHEAFRRPGIYGEAGSDYPDNAFRFALLSRAALHVPPAFGFTP